MAFLVVALHIAVEGIDERVLVQRREVVRLAEGVHRQLPVAGRVAGIAIDRDQVVEVPGGESLNRSPTTHRGPSGRRGRGARTADRDVPRQARAQAEVRHGLLITLATAATEEHRTRFVGDLGDTGRSLDRLWWQGSEAPIRSHIRRPD